MQNLKTFIRARVWETAFTLALAALAWHIWQRHAGTMPSVFADEQIYSHFARLVPLKDVTIPSYLYLSAYSLTNACGAGFLDCARLLNLAFFIASAPFIYLAARVAAPRPAALLAALLCVAAPTSTFTAYFMPESMYFFGFAVLTWLSLARPLRSWSANALAPGVVLGLMTLVKVHALFLMPALAMFSAYMAWRRREGALRAAAASAINVAAAIGTKFAVGYLLIGPGGLQLLGSFYGNQASDGLSAGPTLAALLPPAWYSLKGHLMVMVLAYALPVAFMVEHALETRPSTKAVDNAGPLMLYTVLMLGAALALTVLYTASTAAYGPFEGKRLHIRYYTFALILPVMLVAAAAGMSWATVRRWLPRLAAAALVAAMGASLAGLADNYRILLADAPEVVALGLEKTDAWTIAVICLNAATLALWAINRKAGAIAWLVLTMPVHLWHGERLIGEYNDAHNHPSPYDKAGIYAREHLTLAQRNQLRVVGPYMGELLRTRFHVDAPEADSMMLPPGWKIEPYSLPGRKEWLLVVDGAYTLPPGVTPVFRNALFMLVPLKTSNRKLGEAKFNVGLDNGVLAGADGLAGPEGWGRWSVADQVRLHFKEPLPKRVHLFLTMQAFGPNVGQDFVVRVGGAEQRVKLAPTPHEVFLAFDTDGMQRTVEIDVPQAVSPKELGSSGDIRRLGLGITRLETGVPAK